MKRTDLGSNLAQFIVLLGVLNVGVATSCAPYAVSSSATTSNEGGIQQVNQPPTGADPYIQQQPPSGPSPRPPANSASANSSMFRQNVLRVMNSRMGAFTRCYMTRLEVNPTLAGRVVIRWTIEQNGATSNIAVAESSLNDEQCHACLSNIIARLQFPPNPEGPTALSFPFVFRTRENIEQSDLHQHMSQ